MTEPVTQPAPTQPMSLALEGLDLEALATREGIVAVFAGEDGGLDPAGRKVDALTQGALGRLIRSEAFGKLEPGKAMRLAYPAGMSAECLVVVRLGHEADAATARRAGGAIGAEARGKPTLVAAADHPQAGQIALGALLRAYAYTAHKTSGDAPAEPGQLTVALDTADAFDPAPIEALAQGVFFTRDLVNAPANELTTTRFAEELRALADLGLEVEVLEESELERLGMGALLGVGQGSASPSYVVVMRWMGAEPAHEPVALVGKGVVFDTGGISLKPAQGMEDMTMDMGGAGTVAGVMKSLALRKARANVVGLVGLVENMPDGRAQRPGDIVRSMKGDTIEVINTDAEGRLVLADVLWYAQERFKPAGIIDLATLTGAIIVALGHENTGVFANDEAWADAVLAAARAEDEGAWQMPMGKAYDEMLKSDKADIRNVGGRDAGAITAAQFLARFIEEGTPWAHLDIAGTAQRKEPTALAPKGATGWGVLALNRFLDDHFNG